MKYLTAFLAFFVFAAGLAGAAVRAQESGLSIEEAGSELVDGEYRVHARIDYRLSREALEALQHGVPLTFEVEASLVQRRNWLPNDEIAEGRRVSQLSYDALTRTYVVRNSGAKRGEVTQESFNSLYAALNALGRVADLPLVNESRLDEDAEYEAALRAGLDQQRLPGPLRIISFWRDGLTLESDWYRWTLAR